MMFWLGVIVGGFVTVSVGGFLIAVSLYRWMEESL